MLIKIYEKIKQFIKENYKSLLVFIIIFLLFYIELPFTIYVPGGAINVSDRINIEDGYESDGSLNMAYVRSIKATLPFLGLAKIFDKWDIEKQSDVTYPNESYDDYQKRSRLEMYEAQDAATIIAFNRANLSLTINKEETIVTYITPEADTNLKVGDKVISINNETVKNMNALKEIIQKYSIDNEVTILVTRNNKEKKCYAKLYEKDDIRFIGIMVAKTYDYETDQQIKIKSKRNESGPSGGLMTALAIYNQLTKNDLTNGKKIIGTGTIDIDGNVGAIGGIKYKLLGAEKQKGEVFIVPIDNYLEAKKVKEEYDIDIKLIAVATIDDAIAELNKL